MYVIVKRKLKDFDSWKALVTNLDSTRKEYGSKGGKAYRNAKDPSEVYLIFEWDDRQSYMRYFSLPEVQKALADTGTSEVIEVSETFLIDQ